MKTVFNNVFFKKVLAKGSLLGLAGIVSFSGLANNAYSLEEVFSFKRQNIDVRIFKDASGVALKVTNPNISNVDKFSLPNPSRIVFDITGVKVTNSELVTIKDIPYIKDIRMGAKPPQQTRMVIDVNSSKIPAFNADKAQGEFTIYLGNTAGDIDALRNGGSGVAPQNPQVPANNNQNAIQGGEAEVDIIDAKIVDENQNNNIQQPNNLPNKVENEINKVENQKPNVVEPKKIETVKVEPKKEVVRPTDTPTPLPTNTATPLPTATPVPVETKINVDNINQNANNQAEPQQQPQPQDAQNNQGQAVHFNDGTEQVNVDGGVENNNGCVLSSISFDNDVTGSAIAKIKLNKKVNFSIKTASPELYKVSIPACKLASKNMVLPFFPPPEFKKFVFIQAKEMGNDVEVSIGIESNARLNYLPRNEEIWIKPQM